MRRIRTRPRRSAAALPALAAVVLAGCGGGGPHLGRGDAAPLIQLADKIAREGPCAQARDIRALRARTIALVNAHRVPASLEETLTAGVNGLVEPPCLPAVPADTTRTATIPSGHGHGHGHGHGKGDNGDGSDGGGGGD